MAIFPVLKAYFFYVRNTDEITALCDGYDAILFNYLILSHKIIMSKFFTQCEQLKGT